MPRLLLFAACEKTLIDQDNNLSLIRLLEDLRIDIPEQTDAEISKSDELPVVAMQWSVISMWGRTSADPQDGQYEYRVSLFDPTGKPTIESRATFVLPADKTTVRNVSTILGFPVHSFGRFVLRLWMHEKGQPESPEAIAEYPITLIRGGSKPA